MRSVRTQSRRDATAAVELAVVSAALLVPLLLGLWEMGRLIEAQQLMANAAREGGRQASTGQRSVAEVKSAVREYLERNAIIIKDEDVTFKNLTAATRVDPKSGRETTNAKQLDHFRIEVKVKVADIRWLNFSKFSALTELYGIADWYSMSDVPLEVKTDIPTKPE